MSEEQAQLELEESDTDFNSGYSGTPTETPEKPDKPQVEETPSIQSEPPKFRQITEDEYTKLMSGVTGIDEMRATLEKQFGTAFGKIGGIERVLKQFQDQTPTGQAVQITAEDVADLAEEFPDLAEAQLKVLQKVAGKMRGTGAADIDDDRIHKAVEPHLAQIQSQAVERAKMEMTAEALDETHPDWEKVVGLPDDKGNTPDTPYRKWLATQPQEYQSRVFSSYSPVVIGRSIDKFNESLKKATDSARRNRFDDAVTPKGDGGMPPPADSDDDFEAGFRGR